MINSLSIIFPCFNEEKRLKFTFEDINKFLKKKKIKKFEIIFVDDGSLDKTSKVIKEYISQNTKIKNNIKLISYKKNIGKGNALIKGVAKAKYDWILTADVDISVSILEINSWIKKSYLKKKNYIYFGSRNLKKSNIKFKLYRKMMGIIFINLIKLIFNIKLHDTQCGFKLYKKFIGKKLFKNLKNKDFAHDIEIVLLAKKFRNEIIELPVNWVHKKDGKISLIKDTIKMLFSLIEIRQRFNSK